MKYNMRDVVVKLLNADARVSSAIVPADFGLSDNGSKAIVRMQNGEVYTLSIKTHSVANEIANEVESDQDTPDPS